MYSGDVPEAQAKGTLSRHGILHGQELAFDTYTNSAKCWSLLDVLVQWALPTGRMRAAQVEGRRQSEFAGSQGVDELGRRLDDREFKVTRNALMKSAPSRRTHGEIMSSTRARSRHSSPMTRWRSVDFLFRTVLQSTAPQTAPAFGPSDGPSRAGGSAKRSR